MTEFTITDELYQISEATNKDGTVDVSIYDIDRVPNSDEIIVRFNTPTMEKKSEVMKFPKKDSSDYKFVRICRKTVGSLSAANFLKEDSHIITADPENWELIADLTRREKIREEFSFMNMLKTSSVLIFISIFAASVLTTILAPFVGLATLGGTVEPINHLLEIWLLSLILSSALLLTLD